MGGPIGAVGGAPGAAANPPAGGRIAAGTGGTGGTGGLLEGSKPGSAVTAALRSGGDDYTWAAAAVGSNVASGYQLASGLPVMAIGGFNGSDPSPTLDQFKAYVAAGRIHWFIASGGGRGMGAGGSTSAAIASWVAETFTATTVGGVTMYDLSGGAS
jgi:hypothetical protein